MELLEKKCILKPILLQQNEIGLMGGTRWDLFWVVKVDAVNKLQIVFEEKRILYVLYT
jgi:hypothetical protein